MAAELPDLNMDVGIICFIILKAREFDAEVEEGDPQEASDAPDDDERDILRDYAGNPTLAELQEAIHDLNEDDQITLIALTWLGRGDFDISEWADALATADERHRGDSVDYLTGTPLLGDYLEEGLAAFGLNCNEMAAEHL